MRKLGGTPSTPIPAIERVVSLGQVHLFDPPQEIDSRLDLVYRYAYALWRIQDKWGAVAKAISATVKDNTYTVTIKFAAGDWSGLVVKKRVGAYPRCDQIERAFDSLGERDLELLG